MNSTQPVFFKFTPLSFGEGKGVRFLILFFLFFGKLAVAQNDGIPDLPDPPRLVNNFSKEFPQFLSQKETATLENKLVTFSDSTSNQIVIVIVDSLNGYAPYEYSSKLGSKWGIGQQKFYNGIVILIKPTGGPGKRQIFISPGAGLQGAIPDMVAKQIVEREIIPNYKEGNNFRALDQATDVLMQLAKGEYNYTEYANSNKNISSNFIPIASIILFIIISISRWRRRGYSIGRKGMYWGGGFGGGGFSSGSSGGFGGFGGGGGGFNGGGSGGSW